MATDPYVPYTNPCWLGMIEAVVTTISITSSQHDHLRHIRKMSKESGEQHIGVEFINFHGFQTFMQASTEKPQPHPFP